MMVNQVDGEVETEEEDMMVDGILEELICTMVTGILISEELYMMKN